MSSEERVQITVTEHVAHVRLARPAKRNGLDLAMFEALVAAGERVAADRSVRAVVLSGEGEAFCAGLDWRAMLGGGPELAERLLARGPSSPANLAQRACWIWQEVPVPVIAAVHGVAFGGGLQLALAADVRFVTPDARLCVMEIRYGLVPDMSLTQTLPRLVRADVAKDLVFTGREVRGDEAVSLGLATRVCAAPLEAAEVAARHIARQAPGAIRACKKLLNAALHLEPAASFRLETELQLPLLGSPEQLEAVQAVMQGREPAFADPAP
ncbi:MAG: crotonase/enoyl-CoA hydratase family protein [Myxococcales bacterium]|nr:crotonase/enoyl-CoA hydratase family protein [Myxococcales bacterium]